MAMSLGLRHNFHSFCGVYINLTSPRSWRIGSSNKLDCSITCLNFILSQTSLNKHMMYELVVMSQLLSYVLVACLDSDCVAFLQYSYVTDIM